MKDWDKAAAAVGKRGWRGGGCPFSPQSCNSPYGRETPRRVGFFTAAVCAIWPLASSYFASASNFYLLPRVTIVFPMHKGTPNINIFSLLSD